MRRRLSGAAVNLLTSLVALALGAVAVELLMRLAMDPSQLVGRVPTRPDMNQWYHELRFWERYHARPDALGRHDPLLGWDSSYSGSRARGPSEVSPPSGRRAVAVGDSFVFGNEVDADENFSALLDTADNGLQVLNMGVPGYGIDQSYLKYVHHGSRCLPDVVLFGIYVGDYERTTVAFTTFAKPLLKQDGAGLSVTNQPVPAPAAELARISAALDRRWYLLEYLEHLPERLQAAPHADAFFEATDRLLETLFRDLREHLGRDRQLLIIQFPRGESFTDPDPFHQRVQRHLLAIYARLGLDVIDLDSAFRSLAPASAVAPRFYVVRDNGAVGHLNPAGHRETARLIGLRLRLTSP